MFECVSEGLSQCSHLKQRLDGVNAEIERIKAQLEVAEREFPQSAESDRTKQKLDDEIARQSFKLVSRPVTLNGRDLRILIW